MVFLAPLLLFFFSASVHAQANDKEQPVTRPPSPQNVAASAFIGDRTPINLSLRGRIEEPVTILIRKKPLFGLISQPERVNRQTWRVWYSAAPDSAEHLDSFTYAAKSVDSPVSVAATVQVSIMKRAAQLIFSESLDFGSVPVGDTLIKDVAVRNSGDKTAVVSPAPRAPWKLVDASPVQIQGGETKKIRLSFSPDTSGSFAEKLVLEPYSKRGVMLNGASGNPIQWPSKPVVFASGQREVTQAVSFKNLTDRIREVAFEWPDFLEAPSRVTIQPNAETQIPIQLKAAPSLSWAGPVAFSCGNFKGSLAIVIETAPAFIALDPASVIELGELPLGSSAVTALRLTNSGGRPARLTMNVPNGVKVTPNPANILLEPGETANFQATATPQKVGNCEFSLPVLADYETLGVFRLRAAARAAQPVEKLLSIPVPETISQAPTTPVADIPPVDECILVHSTPHSVTISWKLTSPSTKSFLIERRDIKLEEGGQVKAVWKPWEGADIQISGDSATAHFRKLPPDTFWNIRITGIDSEGQMGQQSKRSFRIETRALNLWTIPFWIWMFGTLALLMFYIRSRKKMNIPET